MSPKVGKCNREIKCGYHYPPKQYFIDNPSNSACRDAMLGVCNPRKIQPPIQIGTLPLHYLINSLSPNSHFISFIKNLFSEKEIQIVCNKYFLGATKTKEVIFLQIDTIGKVRTGKIMQYNPETGKRVKHQDRAINWVHSKLKKQNQLPDDFNLQQCFFGEHLLTILPTATVSIVESEKSAIIASVIMPEMIWLATGSINGLSIKKCHILEGRNVILYPDLGAYEKWNEKAEEIELQHHCVTTVSTILENLATPEAKFNGLDVANYIIAQLQSKKTVKRPSIKEINFQNYIKYHMVDIVIIIK